MSTITEHTPNLVLEEDAGGPKAGKNLQWSFRTGPEVPVEDIRAALELLGADFDPGRNQIALSDYSSEFYGGMDSCLGPVAVDNLNQAIEDLEDFRDAVENWRGFHEMSLAERQEFMDYAVECYSFVAEGSFMDTDSGALRDLANIVSGRPRD